MTKGVAHDPNRAARIARWFRRRSRDRVASSCVFWGLCFILVCGTAYRSAAEGAKRVLIVHSFGSVSPPSTTRSVVFETELTKRLSGKVDLDEVSLDHARYSDADMEEALVEYLQKRQARWQPDLVVPIGSPACLFVGKYRERLFPQTPVLYTGMDRRRLRADALKDNTAYVGESFDSSRFIEDSLQLAPDTTNIICVIGASAMERYWTAALQNDFSQYTNRVGFTWLNDLSFDQTLERVKKLPPRSFIFLFLLNCDAAGVTHNANEAVKRISEVANAPVNSVYEEQLGLGIVGGRLYRPGIEGVESARLAIRILQGEAASSLPPKIIPPTPPEYDWRELHRFNINEDRLPPGSVVKYREPTLWEQYGYLIVTALLVVMMQLALIVGLFFNLRRRRRAERSLRESEDRMKLAASAAALGMWEWDFSNHKVWVDGRARQRVTALNGNGSDYRHFLRTVHPEDRDGVVQAVTRATSGDGNYEHIHRQLGADGEVRWIAARGQVEFDGQHKPAKMRGVAMDITARKLAEEQVRESERRILLTLNSAPVLIWMSGPDKRCTFVNQRWLDFTGRTFEEEMGVGWAESVHPDDRANCLKTCHDSFDARKPFTLEYRVRRHDGQYRWILDHGVPRYDARKQFLGYIGSCVDVTERREAEAEAQRSHQELAHVNRVSTLGALTGSLAHELRQPLTAIVTNAEAGQRFVDGGRVNDEEVREALKEIAEEGRRAGKIIAEMRAMLKSEPAPMARQDMNLVVTAVLEMVRSDLVTRGVTTELRLDPRLPAVNGHGVQLRQVILNLVMNACDAMSEESAGRRKLTIESKRAGANEVEVSVADTGSGFQEEVLGHAFESFRTTKAQGLGLGLSICQSIIASHGGCLMAANNGDKGATVRFTLLAQDERDV